MKTIKEGSQWSLAGKVYTIVGVSNLPAGKPGWVPTVVYRDSKGHMWSRPLDSWVQRGYTEVKFPT